MFPRRRIKSSTRLNPKCKMYHPGFFRWIVCALISRLKKHHICTFLTCCSHSWHSCKSLFTSQVAWASKLHELSPIRFSMCNSAQLWPRKGSAKQDQRGPCNKYPAISSLRRSFGHAAHAGTRGTTPNWLERPFLERKPRRKSFNSYYETWVCKSRAPLAFHVEAQVLGLSGQKYTIIWH